jgi:hypothetical protein
MKNEKSWLQARIHVDGVLRQTLTERRVIYTDQHGEFIRLNGKKHRVTTEPVVPARYLGDAVKYYKLHYYSTEPGESLIRE